MKRIVISITKQICNKTYLLLILTCRSSTKIWKSIFTRKYTFTLTFNLSQEQKKKNRKKQIVQINTRLRKGLLRFCYVAARSSLVGRFRRQPHLRQCHCALGWWRVLSVAKNINSISRKVAISTHSDASFLIECSQRVASPSSSAA